MRSPRGYLVRHSSLHRSDLSIVLANPQACAAACRIRGAQSGRNCGIPSAARLDRDSGSPSGENVDPPLRPFLVSLRSRVRVRPSGNVCTRLAYKRFGDIARSESQSRTAGRKRGRRSPYFSRSNLCANSPTGSEYLGAVSPVKSTEEALLPAPGGQKGSAAPSPRYNPSSAPAATGVAQALLRHCSGAGIGRPHTARGVRTDGGSVALRPHSGMPYSTGSPHFLPLPRKNVAFRRIWPVKAIRTLLIVGRAS